METFAAILSRLSNVAVFGLILTAFAMSISSIVNAEELTVAMAETSAATELTNADPANADTINAVNSPRTLSDEMIEEVREDLARRLRTDIVNALKAG